MNEAAVVVKDAYKSFSIPVLKGFSMTVQLGSIYSLLGPSGCGKTTLLSCILGLDHLTSGTVELSVARFRDVGYMPQEVSLHLELTVSETFEYYGCIHSLDRERVKRQRRKYMDLFEITASSDLLSTLSGGQRRRVSLALSMFHDPQLIVMDEPTVGLDPLLREKVWSCLMGLSREEGKTMILTTHYIEEAKNSDRVGLMRGGVILEEDNPLVLMAKMDCSSMEETFLKICNSQREETQDTDETYGIVKRLKYIQVSNTSQSSKIKNDRYFSFCRFYAHVINILIRFKRSPWILMLIFGLPIIQAVIFEAIYIRPKIVISLGFYSEEMTHQDCSVSPVNADNTVCFTPSYSCRFLDALQKNLTVVQYRDIRQGFDDVMSGHVSGMFVLGSNFTPSYIERISRGLWASDQAYEMSSIDFHYYVLEYPFSIYLQLPLAAAMKAASAEIAGNCGISPRLTGPPIEINNLYEDEQVSNFEAASFIISFVFYYGMSATSGLLLEEKHAGAVDRMRVSGLTRLEMISALMSVDMLVLMLESLSMYSIIYYWSGLLINGSVFLSLFVINLQGMIGALIGVLCVEFLQNTMIVAGIVNGFNLSSTFLTGGMWTEEGMWWGVVPLSWLMPVTPGVHALRSITITGATWSQTPVITNLLASFSWILLLSLTISRSTAIQRVINYI